jgi:GTPase SAR1 family protein
MNKKLKFVLIGDSLVGKTAFLLRLDSGVFVTNTMVTLGKEYKVRKEIIDGKTINV